MANGTPAASALLAYECRRSCRRTLFKAAPGADCGPLRAEPLVRSRPTAGHNVRANARQRFQDRERTFVQVNRARDVAFAVGQSDKPALEIYVTPTRVGNFGSAGTGVGEKLKPSSNMRRDNAVAFGRVDGRRSRGRILPDSETARALSLGISRSRLPDCPNAGRP